MNFNSIKVRLKQKLEMISSYFVLFQFHKGTIKTIKYQFCHNAVQHFNSIKVRLKLAVATGIIIPMQYFNSIKVRLKHSSFLGSLSKAFSFQFHKGTIKTISLEEWATDVLWISIP